MHAAFACLKTWDEIVFSGGHQRFQTGCEKPETVNLTVTSPWHTMVSRTVLEQFFKLNSSKLPKIIFKLTVSLKRSLQHNQHWRKTLSYRCIYIPKIILSKLRDINSYLSSICNIKLVLRTELSKYKLSSKIIELFSCIKQRLLAPSMLVLVYRFLFSEWWTFSLYENN